MLIDTAYLALQLEGPLQSWGFDSQFNRRNTGLMPSKSAILGMCLAALGIDRGSEEEKALLIECSHVRLLSVAIPKRVTKFKDEIIELRIRRITDYHTVGGAYDRNDPMQRPHIPLTAEGKPKSEDKQTVITHRQYLCDASFACVLSGGKKLIEQLAYGENRINPENGLANPVWGLWLGRKACIPTKPVFIGVFATEQQALNKLLDGRPLESFTRQREVDRFEDGQDSLPDQPECFAAPDGIRKFSPRRVRLDEAGF